VHLAATHPRLLDALVLLDAGHTDVEVAQSRDELEATFVADQESYGFDEWSAFFAEARTRVPTWRPEMEERFRAGMEDRDGRIVVRADARAAAWALWGVALEPPSSAHARLGELDLPILLVRSEAADDAEALARFIGSVPSVDIRSVAASGHDLLADAPDETAELVAEWLAHHVREP
jgi:pimeloyl-ACP methyl ester carboxylesterase